MTLYHVCICCSAQFYYIFCSAPYLLNANRDMPHCGRRQCEDIQRSNCSDSPLLLVSSSSCCSINQTRNEEAFCRTSSSSSITSDTSTGLEIESLTLRTNTVCQGFVNEDSRGTEVNMKAWKTWLLYWQAASEGCNCLQASPYLHGSGKKKRCGFRCPECFDYCALLDKHHGRHFCRRCGVEAI